jgi:hypothetical protein
MLDIDKELAKAVKHYWKTRAGQKQRQGGKSGVKDGLKGKYTEPNGELGIRNFAVSLAARAASFARLKR